MNYRAETRLGIWDTFDKEAYNFVINKWQENQQDKCKVEKYKSLKEMAEDLNLFNHVEELKIAQAKIDKEKKSDGSTY